MESGRLKLICWLVGTTAVVLVAGVWFRLTSTFGPALKPVADLIVVKAPKQPENRAPANPTLVVLRATLPKYAKRANAGDLAAATAFYEERSGPLIWVAESRLSDKGLALVNEIRKADDWGLPSSDFDLPQLPGGDLSPEAAANTEITLTLASLKYARYARGGRIADPSRISNLQDHTPPVRQPKLVLDELAASSAPDAYLRALHPQHDQFEKLRQLLIKLRGSDGGDKAIVYGEKLQKVVAELPGATGSISPAPLDGQAKPASKRAADIDRILVNMERWRWMPVDLGKVYVWNNVPEFLTRVVKDGKIVTSDRIVAGQPAWPTPSFSADMKTIVFHPTWGVPDGIKRKELGPLLRKSSGGGLIGLFTGAQSSEAVLEAHNLRAYYSGRPISANQVDWSNVNIGAYEFRQPPGPKNVLGAIKFMFPNKHDVYMHDTPERDLFAQSFRGLSHGCMRVGDPRRLAEILLAEDKGWPQAKVRGMFGGGTQEVELSTRIPVHVTYLTAMVDYEGNLRSFGDLYGLDARLGAAVLGRKVRFATPRYDDQVASILQSRRRPAAAGASAGSGGAASIADVISDIFSP